jgi:hypothetical protein
MAVWFFNFGMRRLQFYWLQIASALDERQYLTATAMATRRQAAAASWLMVRKKPSNRTSTRQILLIANVYCLAVVVLRRYPQPQASTDSGLC